MRTPPSTVDGLIAVADRQWRTLGVRRHDRMALAADLRTDLVAADADGLTAAELIGTDPAGFARRLAEEAGVDQIPARYGAILGIASAGAITALIAGYVLVIGVQQAFVALFNLPRSVHVPVWLAAGVFYGAIAGVVVVGAVLAVRLTMRDAPLIRHTTARMTLLLPPAFLAAIAAAAGFGWALNFRLTPTAIGTEAAIVALSFLAATALARHWSVTTRTATRPV